LLMEDVKHEQLLMVTFSRAAATEFKKRLLELIGNAAGFIEIKTFHSYCFDLLGKVGSIEKSKTIINRTVEKIRNNDIEANRIGKTVLVIDEAQDMDGAEFELIKVLREKNEDLRVIAVGDDDQNIFEFRGASSKYLERFIADHNAKKYELNDNYRSKSNLVEFTNRFVGTISHRLKEIPIVAHQKDNGKISIVRYYGNHLINPAVKDVLSTDLSGSTCVLTQTNDEALQVTGLLMEGGLPAKLIQTNDGFNLYNLLEVRYFIKELYFSDDTFTINDSTWHEAKRKLWENYKGSTKIDICINLIKEFELSNPRKKYKSDFDVFIRESKLEDFMHANGETIFVSTIHKAKGKEFDNVFIVLNGFNPETDEKKRLLYVAMTRAKRNLSIHLNGNYLDGISGVDLHRRSDKNSYEDSDMLMVHLTHKDMWLDYFISRQNLLLHLKSGDDLAVNDEGCLDNNGNCIVIFSSGFKERMAAFERKGYKLKSAAINYMVYWKKEDFEKELIIILPELKLQKA